LKSSRYSKQINLSEIGENGQRKLSAASVALVGCGGLGSIAAPYLAGAGVGKLLLIDADIPDVTNVHRQVFFTGKEEESKATILAHHISQINPEIELEVIPEMLTKENIEASLLGVDLVLECSDDIFCKYLVNDFCHMENIPLVYAAIHKYEGYISLFKNEDEKSIHLRDVFPEPNEDIPTCSEVGVMNTIAGIIGLFQTNEAIKFITGAGDVLVNKLLTFNCLNYEMRQLNLKKNWTGDMNDLFDANEYISAQCITIPEITVAEIFEKPDKFQLVSILADQEHEDINAHVVRKTVDEFEMKAFSDSGKTAVVYCRTGNQSARLVQKIIQTDPNANIKNLKDGLIAYRKFKVLN